MSRLTSITQLSPLDWLARQPLGGYVVGGPEATEPIALAAVALLAADRREAAHQALAWLQREQQADGRLGTTAEHAEVGWPTSVAVLAWSIAARHATGPERKTGAEPETEPDRNREMGAGTKTETSFAEPLRRAVDWLLQTRGEVLHDAEFLGHDTTLLGWPWVEGTHSWVEPTALSVLALKAAGHRNHPRVREGVRLLIDRLLPSGGCNVGNTLVLGRVLRPHLQPTAIALLALAREESSDPRIARSLDYMTRHISPDTATASLAWAVQALAAHRRRPPCADDCLRSVWQRLLRASATAGPTTYHAALLALAGMGTGNPLITSTVEASV